ncbi:hypothetical protein HARCEL1_10680 [Halococcoides cellulosivorans]|uniref:Uncharacterized protein n=1 Tax=Halococcoides cellulosivorans TaxID=1679096 RepID=A0A2R4X2W3_9EURY|nr:hypothetical protein HARCEL1_10680 [Halococcoides cellulosivorans]
MVVQLLKTDPTFRDWFVDQLATDRQVVDFLGVRHSVERDTGESDIEMGFETRAGDHWIVLVENKINAGKQQRQVERYFERGENYVDRNGWDGFRVALIAPEGYVSDSDRAAFEDVITYEDVRNRVERGDHDGSEFFCTVLDEAVKKRTPTDLSRWTERTVEQFRDRMASLPPVEVYDDGTTNKQLRVKSRAPDHPDAALYNVYFPGEMDGAKAQVRLNLTGHKTATVSEEEFEALKPALEREMVGLDGFRSHDRAMEPVKTEHYRSNYRSDREYIDGVVDTLCELIEAYHPLFVANETFE